MVNLADVASVLTGALDNTNQFDLEKENIGGFFSNLTLLSMVLASLTKDKTFSKQKPFEETYYDYVIVGAGTAGSVLANRLTEKSCLTALVLEAGDEPPILTEIPSYARLFHGSPIDWNYKTTPQTHAAFGLNENRVILNSGKVVGGSSAINVMQAVRGNKKNYDQWAAGGATGWSYEDVLPYFLKLEDNRNIDELDEGYHNEGGPMTWEKVNYAPEFQEPVIEAIKDMGYEVTDSNGRKQTGIHKFQMTTRDQRRCSTAKAYLNPARERPNLEVVTNAHARKILIDEGTKSAYGVEFDHGGKTRIVRARREVIVANGAIGTPQLLMLSGIGPREHLEKLNIKVLADLPVGKNLMDHFASFLLYTVSETITDVIVKNLNPVNILDYLINRKGPLCSPCLIPLIAFMNGVNNTSPIDFPAQQVFFGEYNAIDPKLKMNVKPEVFKRVFAPYVTRTVYICMAFVLQPHGRGEITLNSTDPYDMPLIDPKYHQDERDLKTVVEALKVCEAVAKHPALKKIKAEPLKTVVPGCEPYVGDEDKYLTCYARQLTLSTWHYSGTAKMGSKDDPTSVVDPELRVIGINNLRVVNAAVMPIITSGNTNIPVMMVAEKASDIIKQNIFCSDDRR